jgi:hypothetical protein
VARPVLGANALGLAGNRNHLLKVLGIQISLERCLFTERDHRQSDKIGNYHLTNNVKGGIIFLSWNDIVLGMALVEVTEEPIPQEWRFGKNVKEE